MDERLFKGFPRDFLMLLAENSFNDSKTYYEAHKEEIKNGTGSPSKTTYTGSEDLIS